MKLYFYGSVEEIGKGIAELAPDLGIEICENGMSVAVSQACVSDLVIAVHNGAASITYDKKHHFFRALSLLVQHLKAGESDFDICEKPYFTMNGPMFETFIISEILKSFSNAGLDYRYFVSYYRSKDKKKVNRCGETIELEGEIDFIIEENGVLYPI